MYTAASNFALLDASIVRLLTSGRYGAALGLNMLERATFSLCTHFFWSFLHPFLALFLKLTRLL